MHFFVPNLKTLTTNMTIVFSNFSLEIRKSDIFGLKFKDFGTKLCCKVNSRALISNMTMVFQNLCPKHPNKSFLVSNVRIFIFALNFAF